MSKVAGCSEGEDTDGGGGEVSEKVSAWGGEGRVGRVVRTCNRGGYGRQNGLLAGLDWSGYVMALAEGCGWEHETTQSSLIPTFCKARTRTHLENIGEHHFWIIFVLILH